MAQSRSCLICTTTPEHDDELVQPCWLCHSAYCKECLADMFVAATHDISRMPPQCCAIIQIHTAIDALSDEAANAYRAKFEEWITRNRMYCPSPTCSAFIPERQRGEQWQAGFVNDILTEVLHVIYRDSSARFFRGDMPVENLQGYASMVKEPIDLAVMFSKLNSYTSIGEMTRDMVSSVSTVNAGSCNTVH